ncbi:MAG: hypothetical protein NTW41_01425 [Verrucomicrobia bacterium]|nr:hypothetical protein [Verrucomicrobiota bacterium]
MCNPCPRSACNRSPRFIPSTEVQSKARADAIQRESEALQQSPQIIRLRAIEKWDGTLPRITGQSAVPFLNIEEVARDTPPRPTP